MIQIDEEFKKWMWRLTDDEYSLLEENIIKDGCRDPLALWGDVVIDGHNRLEICTKHGVTFKTVQVEISDREEAKRWIYKNQLGKRNSSPDHQSLMRGYLYNQMKKAAHGNSGGVNQHTKQLGVQNAHQPKTSEILAQEYGVHESTIRRDGQFATNIETLKPFVPEIEQMVMSGETTKAAINEAAKEPAKAVTTLATLHTGDEESYTPVKYLHSARTVMGDIDLDPASNKIAQENVAAKKYFTVTDNGLEQEWFGKVWLNPPYTARIINKFIDKVVTHYAAGDVTEAIILTNNNTDTSWFHSAAKTATAICFTAGRINFLKRDGSTSSPTNGQSFFYFGDNLSAFIKEFSQHGLVMVKP